MYVNVRAVDKFLLPKVVNWFQSYDCLLERIRLCFAPDVELSSCLIVD